MRCPHCQRRIGASDAPPAAPQGSPLPGQLPETEAYCLAIAEAIRPAGWDLAGQTVLAVIQGIKAITQSGAAAKDPAVGDPVRVFGHHSGEVDDVVVETSYTGNPKYRYFITKRGHQRFLVDKDSWKRLPAIPQSGDEKEGT
jgi:hypothetical protein